MSRHVVMFQQRFAPKVESGEKACTIRPKRKRPIKIGDTLDLRAWTVKPYRSKQRKLRLLTCVNVQRFGVKVTRGVAYFRLGRELLTETAMHLLAQRDGFYSAQEMVEWFESTHGLPFVGVLIEWKP